MRIPRVFTPQPLAEGQLMALEAGPSHHLARVLRVQPGRELIVFNGTGGEFTAQVHLLDKKTVTVKLKHFNVDNRESPLVLELAIGVSRGERMDWVLQKATELGVSRISPLFTERTEVKLSGERLDKKMDHWRQVIISACEQCQRNLLPTLETPLQFSQWLEHNKSDLTLVLHHRDNRGLPRDRDAPKNPALLVGPEGGLSEQEIDEAINTGCEPLTIGPRVLRTETAPVAAISLVQYLWGDFY